MDADVDRNGREQTRDMERTNEELRRREVDAELLQQIATQTIDDGGIQALYERILDAAQAILQCDCANLQMFYPERGSGGELRLLGQRGFTAEAARRWEWVRPAMGTACGEALRTRQRVMIADVRKCVFMAGTDDLEEYLAGGIHAVQTTPLVSRSGALQGMISTHWREPHELSASDLRALDVLARLVGDLIEDSRREEALRQSEERYRLAVKATNDAIWDIDFVTGTVHWNETYAALYGRPPEMSKSCDWWIDRIHPEDRERTSQGFRSAIIGGEATWSSEYRFLRLDGQWAYIYDRAYIARDSSGTARRAIGAMQDVTERKRAEAALRESDLQYKEIFDHLSVCMFLIEVTPEGRFKYAAFNRAEEEAIGLSSAEVSGRFVEDVFGEELAGKLTADYRRCLDAGLAIDFDSELNLAGGRRYFHSNLIPLRNAAGVINRIIGCVDVTDLRRTREEALAKQNLETLGVLAGGIAHDFNNVLGGILAQAELAEMELAVGSRGRQQLQTIEAAALRGSKIVRELMIYAGQDQTKHAEPVHVSRLVSEMLELLKVSISKQAVFRTDLCR